MTNSSLTTSKKINKLNKRERSIILEPVVDINYDTIVKIMDSVRVFRNTDEKIWIKDTDGDESQAKYLFDKIVFGNIKS